MKIACYCFDFPCLPSLLLELHDTKTLCQLRFFFSYTPSAKRGLGLLRRPPQCGPKILPFLDIFPLLS